MKFGPKPLFRAWLIPAWPIWPNRLPAWAPGPKTWAWAGEEALPRRPARPVERPATASRWIPSNGSQHARAAERIKTAGRPALRKP